MGVGEATAPFAVLTSTNPSTHLSFPALGLRPWWRLVRVSQLFPGALGGWMGDVVMLLGPISSLLCDSR